VRKSTTPDDQLVSDAVIGDPGPIADRGQALLARPSEGMLAGPVSLVTGLCLASHSPGSQGVARELLLRALREASLANPWPARALAMIDGARARPEEAIAPLTEWMARAPKDELTGYQLACLQVGAGRLADALVVTQRLIGLPDGDAARLLCAWLALALGDSGRAQSFLAPLEADLAGKSRPVEARVLALKGRILLARGAAAAAVQPVLEGSIAKDRGCTWALLPLGRLMVLTKRPEEAIAHYQQYLRLRPFSWEVHAGVVKLLEQTRFHAQALGEYRWLLGHVGRQRAWADGFLRMANELARPDLVRYEAVRH
jgi:predicted Zn-dependent protease